MEISLEAIPAGVHALTHTHTHPAPHPVHELYHDDRGLERFNLGQPLLCEHISVLMGHPPKRMTYDGFLRT